MILDDNIILFPKMKEQLAEDIEKEMKKGNYSGALEKLDVLREHGFVSYPIHIQTLISYIRLNRFTEAEMLCEELLEENNQHYFDYLDYYIMILYEAGKYQAVIDRVDEEEQTGELPEEYQMKFGEIKRIAKQMNEWESMELIKSFQQAVKDNRPTKQYYLIQKWRKLHTQAPAIFYDLLKEEDIHPVIKTILFLQLADEMVTKEVFIRKFTYEMEIIPRITPKIENHPIYQKTIQQLEQMEQENPTMYVLMKEMYDQYCFVMYPFMHTESEIEIMVSTLFQIVQVHFGNEPKKENTPLIEQIETCSNLYQQIMLQ